MTADEFISTQPEERQRILTALHSAILAKDKAVIPVVEPMMGKEMIIYKERGYMKYGLSSVKNYMTIHCMPIYMNQVLRDRYQALLPAAKFQKGCINFNKDEDLPQATADQLFSDCAAVSIADMLESRRRHS